MSGNRISRRTLAIIGLLLGLIFIAGTVWTILVGDAEWWSGLIVVPVLYIMYRLYDRWIKPAR